MRVRVQVRGTRRMIVVVRVRMVMGMRVRVSIVVNRILLRTFSACR